MRVLRRRRRRRRWWLMNRARSDVRIQRSRRGKLKVLVGHVRRRRRRQRRVSVRMIDHRRHRGMDRAHDGRRRLRRWRRWTSLLLLLDRGTGTKLPRPSLSISLSMHEKVCVSIQVMTDTRCPTLSFALEAEIRIFQLQCSVDLLQSHGSPSVPESIENQNSVIIRRFGKVFWSICRFRRVIRRWRTRWLPLLQRWNPGQFLCNRQRSNHWRERCALSRRNRGIHGHLLRTLSLCIFPLLCLGRGRFNNLENGLLKLGFTRRSRRSWRRSDTSIGLPFGCEFLFPCKFRTLTFGHDAVFRRSPRAATASWLLTIFRGPFDGRSWFIGVLILVLILILVLVVVLVFVLVLGLQNDLGNPWRLAIITFPIFVDHLDIFPFVFFQIRFLF